MKNTDINLEMIAKKAKEASYKLASLSTEVKNKALKAIAENINLKRNEILKANQKDIEIANELEKQGKLTKAVISRLKLTDEKINVIIQGINDVINLEDPANKIISAIELDENLELYKVSCPIGVIGVIFESRPDVVPQIASLAVKSANSVILKGGSEANNSNTILVETINEALNNVDEFPKNSISLIKTREDVSKMLKLDDYIDLIIPRGSNSLVKYIQSNTKIPVLGHADGICHIFIDNTANFDFATKVSVDSKIQYPSACNAVETILLHEDFAKKSVAEFIKQLQNNEIKLKIDEKINTIISGENLKNINIATEEDWKTEYGEKIVSLKIVTTINEAIEHINKYGSGHTDCIITENKKNVDLFMNLVDSAGVYHNVSTRFADGFRYGLGAEVGISTNKTHARGPVGLEGLCIYKYKMYGNGQIVAEYSGDRGKSFTHKTIK